MHLTDFWYLLIHITIDLKEISEHCFLGNHKGVFKAAGFSTIKEYRYWNDAKKNLDIDGMLQDLQVGLCSS